MLAHFLNIIRTNNILIKFLPKLDPHDCSRYHVCTDVGSEGILHQCPDNLIYDSAVKLCRSKLHPSECNVFNCIGKFNEFITFVDRAFYAFCVTPPNNQTKILVFKCPDELNQIFNLETKQCEYRCHDIGQITDREDCEGYISCSFEDNRYISRRIKCPEGHFFRSNQCVLYSTKGGKCEPEIVATGSLRERLKEPLAFLEYLQMDQAGSGAQVDLGYSKVDIQPRTTEATMLQLHPKVLSDLRQRYRMSQSASHQPPANHSVGNSVL